MNSAAAGPRSGWQPAAAGRTDRCAAL